MASERFLNKLVIAKTAQGEVQFVGRCISYCDAPTVGVNLPDGTHGNWRADLCDVIELPDRALDLLMPAKGVQGQISQEESLANMLLKELREEI